jgi:hypothetical protein
MATNVEAPNLVRVEQVGRSQIEIKTSDAARIGHYNFLSEMVELIYGMTTLCWIITSLCALT